MHRAATILGLGMDQIRSVPVSEKFVTTLMINNLFIQLINFNFKVVK
jgi:hypothetical protein